MSELDHSTATSSKDSIRSAHTDDYTGVMEERPEREGLPRGYRMRADSHYVDQLESRYHGPAISLIPTRHIEMVDLSPAAGLTGLADSIKTLGVVQPLLVRRHGGRYQIIAGRRRLAAAASVGVTEVPCIVHDVDETAAAALAEADNFRALAREPAPPPPAPDCLHEVLQALSYDLAGMGSLVAFLRPASASVLQHQATADLLQAQAWRAAWLASAAAVLTSPYRPGRLKPAGSIVERIRAGLEAEARLARLRLDVSVAPDAAALSFDENLGSALAGLIFATLAWVQGCEAPRIEVRADTPTPRSLKIEVVQRLAPVPEEAARHFRAPAGTRPGDLTTTLGLLTARTIAEAYRGRLDFIDIGRRGSVIQAELFQPPDEQAD